jgi:cytohesin
MCAESNRAEMADYLISHGAAIEARDSDNRTPLHRAAENNGMDVVKALVNHEAQVEVKDSIGRTPADVADARGHKKIAELLKVHRRG